MLLTEKEKQKWKSVKGGCWSGQHGITIRMNNAYWFEVCGTLGTAQGDMQWEVIRARKGRHEST